MSINHHQRYNVLSVAGLAIIFVILALFGYWQFIDPDVIEVKDPESYAVDKTTYNPGDRITYIFEYCKREKSVAVVTRALVDTYRINYINVSSDLPTGCHKISKNDLVIPEFIAGEGHTYHIEGTAIYQVNPIRKQYVYFRTVDFIIK